MAEKPIDPRIDAALKKCNPQKAIYALADLVDDYQGAIDRAQTTADGAQQTAETAQETADTALTNANAANAAATKAETDAANALTTANSAAADASEAAENALDAKTQAGEALRASTAATTTANEASNVANAASTLAGTAQNRANEAYAYAGDVDNKVIQTNVDLNNLKTATNSALIGITAATNTSTVTLDLERIVGTDNVPLPVASATQAGVLNANDYKQLQDYAGRIGALEGSLAIYPVTLPSDNPSSEQITNAYTSQYPDAPNPPLDNTTVSDVQRKITYRYTSIGNTWIQVSYEVTQQFTNSSPGTIKGSTSAGMISANVDGTGSLNGYDALNSGVAGSLSEVTAEGTATAINLVTTKNNGTQTVVTLPQASNTQGGTITAADYQKLQNPEVPIFTNDVLGTIKGSTEDGKISANADGTGSLVGYDQIKNDIAANATGIQTLTTNLGTTNSNVTALTTRVNTNTSNIANAVNTINAVGTGTGASINYVKMGGTQASTALPVVSADQGGIVTPTMFNAWNSGSNYYKYRATQNLIKPGSDDASIAFSVNDYDFQLRMSRVADTVLTESEILIQGNYPSKVYVILDYVFNGSPTSTPTDSPSGYATYGNSFQRITLGRGSIHDPTGVSIKKITKVQIWSLNLLQADIMFILAADLNGSPRYTNLYIAATEPIVVDKPPQNPGESS